MIKKYSAAQVSAIRRKEQKITKTIALFEKIRAKVLARKKLTRKEESLYVLSTSYGFVNGANQAIKKKLV